MTHILVTGASGGIGAAICRALARRGVTVLLHYRSNRTAAEATRQALEGGGHSLIELALGWLASKPFVSSIIVGATHPEQVEENVRSLGWRLSAEEMAAVDEIAG